MYTLSLFHREDRRTILEFELRKRKKLKHAFVFGDKPSPMGSCRSPVECCLLGWITMVRNASAFPALFTEDDIDLRERLDPLLIPKPIGSILSIAAGNCGVENCSSSQWVQPRRKHPYTFGTAAIVITDASAASEFVSWIQANHTRKWIHIDGKLYLSKMPRVSILCPPLFSWRKSFSDIILSKRSPNDRCPILRSTKIS